MAFSSYFTIALFVLILFFSGCVSPAANSENVAIDFINNLNTFKNTPPPADAAVTISEVVLEAHQSKVSEAGIKVSVWKTEQYFQKYGFNLPVHEKNIETNSEQFGELHSLILSNGILGTRSINLGENVDELKSTKGKPYYLIGVKMFVQPPNDTNLENTKQVNYRFVCSIELCEPSFIEVKNKIEEMAGVNLVERLEKG